MNKLQEAGNKVRERILSLADSEGRLDYGSLDMIEETVREVCSEYARSIIPSNYYCGESYDYGEGFEHGSNQTIELIKTRIDQDLLSLKENKDT